MPEKKDKNTNKKKIAILFGGCSSEYEVSLQSAYAVITHIDTEAYEPVLIGIARDGKWYQPAPGFKKRLRVSAALAERGFLPFS